MTVLGSQSRFRKGLPPSRQPLPRPLNHLGAIELRSKQTATDLRTQSQPQASPGGTGWIRSRRLPSSRPVTRAAVTSRRQESGGLSFVEDERHEGAAGRRGCSPYTTSRLFAWPRSKVQLSTGLGCPPAVPSRSARPQRFACSRGWGSSRPIAMTLTGPPRIWHPDVAASQLQASCKPGASPQLFSDAQSSEWMILVPPADELVIRAVADELAAHRPGARG